MITILLIFLVLVDFIMLGAIFFLGKQRVNPVEILKEITQEKRELREIEQAFREDLKQRQQALNELYKKINAIAAEAEFETRSYKEVLAKEMSSVLEEFSSKLNSTAERVTKQKSSLSHLLQKSEKERKTLHRFILKAEKLGKFFNKVPYEQVLEEIEDKKYIDARHLLAQGMTASEVASEVGLPLPEVTLIAAIG